jgi:hypothetical protein
MKVKVWGAILLGSMMGLSAIAAETAISGTWSGNWTPKGGVPDAITIELKQDNAGMVTGKFVNPAQVEFSKTTFNPKTGIIMAEATDQKSGKHYKLDGKIEGTELKGTLVANEVTGEVRLIKWTFFGR